MRVILTVSTGAKIVVWRTQDVFHAHRSGTLGPPQICLAVDLFEVIAELADLDLDDGAHATEAVRLAEEAQRRLFSPPAGGQTRAE
jgi:hypothetical protein